MKCQIQEDFKELGSKHALIPDYIEGQNIYKKSSVPDVTISEVLKCAYKGHFRAMGEDS